MDTYQVVLVTVLIVAGVASLVGIWLLLRYGPWGSVLVVAVLAFLASQMIHPGMSRELNGLVAILEGIAVIGGIVGLNDLSRGPRKPPGGGPGAGGTTQSGGTTGGGTSGTGSINLE